MMAAVQYDDPERTSSDETEEVRLTLGEHLEELRQRLIRVAVALAIGLVAGWILQPYAYEQLKEIVVQNTPETTRLVLDQVAAAFLLKLKLSFYIGLMLTLPFTVMQMWGFIAPGLKKSERKPLRIVAPVSILLFLFGATLCWYVLPLAIKYFAGFATYFEDAELYLRLDDTIFFLVKLILAFGIGFQLPMVVFFLTKVGIITPQTLLKYWRQALVAIFAASALITPTGDMVTLTIMAVPLSSLFFLSVWAARVSRRRAGLDEIEDLD